ncbi:hypothetical protein AGMMS49532_03840 [Endomicrobiia bacterium]|nr:hypothetical protein AGMMS49532_03840 [Endomicrobiia bacterium]
MKMLKYIIFLLVIVFFFNDCSVSYPKNYIVQSLEKLVKKECNQDSKAYLVGRTLYLDMEFDEITSADDKTALQAIRKMNLAIFTAGRIVLSSDSDIKYIVVTTYDSYKNLAFRIAHNIDDIKNYFYMRISHSNFNSRKLLEIEGPLTAANMIEDRHCIADQEYIGRLIVSQINMLSAADVVLVQMPRLQYVAVENETLIFSVSDIVDSKNIYLVKNILLEKTKDYSKKYNIYFKGIKVVAFGGEALLIE